MNTILVLGDSYILRLKQDIACNSRGYQANFGTRSRIFFRGQSGGTVSKIIDYDLGYVCQLQPDLVLLHVGGNDLRSDEESPAYVAMELINLAVRLVRDMGVNQVIISGLCKRHKTKFGSRYPLPVNYNSQVAQANAILADQVRRMARIHLWLHCFPSNPAMYDADGVHFNIRGKWRFYKSLRTCVQKAVRGQWGWTGKSFPSLDL